MVSSATYSALELYLTDNPKEANAILGRIMKTRKQREEIRKIKDANSDTKKSMVDKFKGKLADCSSHTKVEDRMLIIVEGVLNKSLLPSLNPSNCGKLPNDI